MPEFSQGELDYVEGHAASCICVKCEDQRKQTDNAVAAMRGVTADPPEGAVLELVEAARAIEWIWSGYVGSYCPKCHNEQKDKHKDDCELDAALSRFRGEGGVMSKDYVDDYSDTPGRIDVKCPYCNGLHATAPGAYSWACVRCDSVFVIPLWSQIPILNRIHIFTGHREGTAR